MHRSRAERVFAPLNVNDLLFNASCTYRHLEWHNLEAVVGEDSIIRVKDVLTDAEERLGT